MCLSSIMSHKSQKEWLAKQHGTIIAYKFVIVKDSGNLYPPYYVGHRYNKIKENKVKTTPTKVYCSAPYNEPRTYVPYYHFFYNEDACWCWADYRKIISSGKIMKCEIKKEDITCIGTQEIGPFGEMGKYTTIVAKAFKFIKEEACV